MDTEPSNTLDALFNQMSAEQQICLKQAVVRQTVYYVTHHLPPAENEDGQRNFIWAAEKWIDDPTIENANFANAMVAADLIDGGARNRDYPSYFLTPADAAGSSNAILASRHALEAAGSQSEIARQWQIAAAESILQGQELPEFDHA